MGSRVMDTDVVDWTVSGSYFEACNCEAVCPCRSQGGRDGGRSTYGSCDFVLSWAIRAGRADDVVLDGLSVVMAGRYLDDAALAAGKPLGVWEVVLYVDERADEAQAATLTAIFLGRAGGTALENFAAAIGKVHAVRSASVRLDHEPGDQHVAIDHVIEVRAREPVATSEQVSCGIPGHDHPGQEWVADVMRVDEEPLHWEVTGRCAFATDFLYSST